MEKEEQPSHKEASQTVLDPYQREQPLQALDSPEKDEYDSIIHAGFPRRITMPEDSGRYSIAFLEQELSVPKLNSMHRHLWWAGRPGNVRPLHRQLMLSRRILITEDPALHLVWYNSTIFMKPLPLFLINWEGTVKECCPPPQLQRLADGFLSTYLRLICYPSDLTIARDLGLLPDSTTWSSWCTLSNALRRKYPIVVNKRYLYGELRLSRLNQICRFCRLERQYFSPYTEYGHFFTSNFAWFFVMFACLSVVLGALQVVLATSEMTKGLSNMAYGFSVFAIGLTFGAVMFVIGLFSSLFVYFLQDTLRMHARAEIIAV